MLGHERNELLLAAVNRLPEEQRLVVVCRFILDLSEAETASVLGLRPEPSSRGSRGRSTVYVRRSPEMTELERELRGLAAAIAFPETPAIAANLRLSPRPERLPRSPRSWRTVAIVVAVCARGCHRGRDGRAPGPDVDPALFGIGEVRIEFVDRLPEVRPDAPLDLGTAIDSADAPFPLLRPAVLGKPDGIYRIGRRRHVALRHAGTGPRSRHRDRELGLHAHRGQEARRGRNAGRVRADPRLRRAGALDHRRAARGAATRRPGAARGEHADLDARSR